MPCAVDYILEGLAENLELERELGSFAVEFDRAFLASLPKEREQRAEPSAPAGSPTPSARPPAAIIRRTPAVLAEASDGRLNFVFLHHAPLGSDGAAMMVNVVKAIRQTPETAPIVFEGDKPAAKIYVVLGPKALNRWYEGVSIAKGGWFRDVDSEVFYTHSPDEIFRFGSNLTPAMQRLKRDMWTGLQEGMRKLGSGK